MPALVIDGHPSPDSLVSALARRYAEAHGDAVVLAVRDLDFDPVLRAGYRAEQPLEPDLERALEAIFAADHVVVATPVWWASTPALLKGFLDRVLLPRVAYRYRANGFPEGLLRGRTGRVIMTSDSPRWFLHGTGDPAMRQLRAQTLRFCGIRRVRASRFTGVRHADAQRRSGWLERVAEDARRDAARASREAPGALIARPVSA
ncbi:NAD(P)H-dependent oxidoreductase [Microbacterium barkeri]|uniref:NAD(P)H-dependent oxidoreductase n=1 Tax=Microbacterium barkeri TaxID=33917 RepID=UPI0024AE8EA3|nr:NAD(P)H-dependent oxidoreductase [Microbacterium barkeri]MDI6942482.1 NAD(P)H-dependent oxidoreductase [Microbacterium barkeri]